MVLDLEPSGKSSLESFPREPQRGTSAQVRGTAMSAQGPWPILVHEDGGGLPREVRRLSAPTFWDPRYFPELPAGTSALSRAGPS